jgi:molybdopterin-guanine dinucleotide biosynthesis protein A
MATSVVKIDFNGETRRFTLPKATATWNDLVQKIGNIVKAPTSEIVVTYTDDDGDILTLHTDIELVDLLTSYDTVRLTVSLKNTSATEEVQKEELKPINEPETSKLQSDAFAENPSVSIEENLASESSPASIPIEFIESSPAETNITEPNAAEAKVTETKPLEPVVVVSASISTPTESKPVEAIPPNSTLTQPGTITIPIEFIEPTTTQFTPAEKNPIEAITTKATLAEPEPSNTIKPNSSSSSSSSHPQSEKSQTENESKMTESFASTFESLFDLFKPNQDTSIENDGTQLEELFKLYQVEAENRRRAYLQERERLLHQRRRQFVEAHKRRQEDLNQYYKQLQESYTTTCPYVCCSPHSTCHAYEQSCGPNLYGIRSPRLFSSWYLQNPRRQLRNFDLILL